MPRWQEIVGQGFTPNQFIDYFESLTFRNWRPKGAVLHNTYKPTLATWKRVGAPKYLQALVSYYRDTLGWHAGPHLFVDDRLIYVFTPLIVPGVHSPSYNTSRWGVELVGDFDTENDPDVIQNGCSALATLYEGLGLDPANLLLHKEDPGTTHKGCPGKFIVKKEIIATVSDKLARRRKGDHLADRGQALADFTDVIGGSSQAGEEGVT